MRVIIITDIFGLTEAVNTLENSLSEKMVYVTVVDPYDGEVKGFLNEQDAYDAFISQCGHSTYISHVKTAIELAEENVVLLGFSAGAAAAWKAIDDSYQKLVEHFVGFYPSQIRSHLDVVPGCPVTLVFPCKEEHFDICKVIDSLSALEMVFCFKTELYHGFMNPLSWNYSSSAAAVFNKAINQASKLADVATFRRLLQQH